MSMPRKKKNRIDIKDLEVNLTQKEEEWMSSKLKKKKKKLEKDILAPV